MNLVKRKLEMGDLECDEGLGETDGCGRGEPRYSRAIGAFLYTGCGMSKRNMVT